MSLILWAAAGLVAAQEVDPGTSRERSGAEVDALREVIGGEAPRTELVAYRRAAGSVASVERSTPDGTEVGCGFFVDDEGTFVTVLSSAGDTLQLKVKFRGTEYLPQLLTMDPYTRLAVFRVEGVDARGLELVPSRSLEVGDFAIAVAATEEVGDRCTVGRVAGREKNFAGVPLAATLMRLNMEARPGTFGAPLVDVTGAVGGVVLMSVGAGDGVCYALPSELIDKVRRDYRKHGKVQGCWMGIGLAQGTTTPAIVSLSDDSPAKQAGLRPGDVIRQIGDRPVREYQDVVDACYYLTAEEAVTIKVMRGLEDLTVEVVPSVSEGERAPGGKLPPAGEVRRRGGE